ETLNGVSHGFFTRKGGTSSGIFEGLNCGAGSSDQAECVRLNRARAAQAMGVDASQLVSLNQVHSADVVEVEEPFANRPTGDAMITTRPGIALGILTADCAPVLFAADGVVGAAHA
ncbi:MAG: laccase domain-containing protein, partial [Pseudomonadota bacterium]